jgi:hypothetical protein
MGNLETPEPQLYTELGQGSALMPIYSQRMMNVYAMPESELRSVAFTNGMATAFFSAASGAFSFGAGILVNGLMQTEWTPMTEAIVKLGTPICAVLTGMFLLLAIWAARTRGSMLDQIRSESRIIPANEVKPPRSGYNWVRDGHLKGRSR